MQAIDFYSGLKSSAADIHARYRAVTQRSEALTTRAAAVMPGGSSRDALLRKPYAPYAVSGQGGWLTDVDGRQIIDLWFNATSLPLGHCHPLVLAAAADQMARGTAFFASTEVEVDVARELQTRLPSAARVRFTNSGSEAVMLAVRIARAFTGRTTLAKFEGSYHGSYDDVSWSLAPLEADAGPIERPVPVPASAGLPSAAGRTTVLPFNDLESTVRILREQSAHIAAVIVEPVANRMGLLPPRPGFLEGLQAHCRELGILLIFDEVIAFRVGFHGAQGLTGVTPDLTTLGKIIGGGFPVGAVAGSAEVMAVSEPYRPGRVAHYGTFNANPMTMAAGKATLQGWTPTVIATLNATAEQLRSDLRTGCTGMPVQVTGTGSLFKITATSTELTNHRAMLTADRAWEELMSLALLTEGFLLTPALQGCLSTATTPEQIGAFVQTFERLLRES